MNYLAHLFFAAPTPQSAVGNLLPDFQKGKLKLKLLPDVHAGYHQHRFIDRMTDTHPIFIRSKQRIGSKRRLFSGIIIDVAYDHYLAVHWQKYSDIELARYIQLMYQCFDQYTGEMPEIMQWALVKMAKEDWLGSYQTLEGIDDILNRISRRIKHDNNLHGAIEDVRDHYEEIEQDFLAFFPALIQMVQSYQADLRSDSPAK